jgi:hypothetical protein
VYAETGLVDEELHMRAALRYGGDRAALSHITALGRWGLPVPQSPIHLLVGHDLRSPKDPGLSSINVPGSRMRRHWL